MLDVRLKFMRIYFIGQKGIPTIAGGIEKYVENVAVRLAAKGHEVFVYTRPYYTDKNLGEYKGVHLISLPTIRSKNLDAIFHTFLATVDVLFRQADVIHYQGIGPALLLWLPKIFKRKTLIVSTVHSDDRQHTKWSRFAKIMMGFGARIAIKWADKSIAVAASQKIAFESEFGGTLVHIPNGVNICRSLPARLITEKFSLMGQDYLFFIARFIPHKGLHYLIEAYQNVMKGPAFANASARQSKKLVVVGGSAYTDDYSKYVKTLANDDPNIIFTGELKPGELLYELYSNAYLFVIPSEYEGFSFALIEIMSCGTPVLASDIPPNKEALGGLGLTFENKNVQDLQNKLEWALNNPQALREMGVKLQERVMREYDWDTVVKRTEELYEAELARKYPRPGLGSL